MIRSRLRQRGFTMVEVMVATLLVSIAVVGAFGGIRSVTRADSRARTADLLQKLAAEKINDFSTVTDPTTNGTAGNFADRGYQDIQWSLDVATTTVTNLEQITVTVTQGSDKQTLTTEVYVPALTTTATGTAAP